MFKQYIKIKMKSFIVILKFKNICFERRDQNSAKPFFNLVPMK